MNASFVIASLKFYTTKDGGLRASFDRYVDDPEGKCSIGFPMDLDGQYYDFRIYHLPARVILGQTQEVMLRFLSPDVVIPLLKVGGKYTFWYNGRTIGEFTVLEIHDYGGMDDVQTDTRDDLWMARGLRRPDFYLRSESSRFPVACFIRFHASPEGEDCVCGVRIDPPLVFVAKNEGRNERTEELTLYCFEDVFDSNRPWPRRVVILRKDKPAEGDEPILEVRGVGVLHKNWTDVLSPCGDNVAFDIKTEDGGVGGVQQRTKLILLASGRM